MTMHLSRHSMIRSTRKGIRYTKSNMERWRASLIEVNKQRKRQGEVKLSLDEYIDQLHGIKSKKDTKKSPAYSRPKTLAEERIDENRKKYKSVLTDGGDCTLPNKDHVKEAKSKYTIAPAYNKSGYMVIPVDEIKFIGK